MTSNDTPASSSGGAEAVEPTRPKLSGLRTTGGVVAAVIGVVVTYLALGTLFPAGSRIITFLPAFVWATAGPHLVVLSVVGVLLCVPLWRAGFRPVLRVVAAAFTVFAVIASVTITAVMVTGAHGDGGSVNLARALTLSTPSQGPDEITSYVTVDGKAQEARVFVPESGAEGAPVLMYIHGGAWNMGSAEDTDSLARWYASRGWFVVNVDYRLSTPDYPTWDKAPQDVACALSWSVGKATAAGADPDRLTVLGDSAGGHLALLLGWSAAGGTATSSCSETGQVPVPDAVVAAAPVSDLEYTYDNGAAPVGVDPREFTSDFLGGSPSSQPERLSAVSPSTYLTDSVPSTLVIQPELDDFIPAEGNYRTVDRAQELGADVTLAKVPFAYHGFDLFPGAIGGQIKNSIVSTYLERLGLAP
ncbi:alpha/beta hydrolase [Rhodococcus fascians]|nr:alpha/beta hydrolase [Rhodococcus fascians]MBY3824213.1 alpha/beta hydrolase [Rhodococcus fascians]MBY3834735.1 alpha/beta hydrolase [Rhodococcus fascians]MBY3863947.1 alpha/beta hydrolase [Rhodococcus fascians]MBY3883418.1 alpha/beta hydrolase [Rhodococcus fascians]